MTKQAAETVNEAETGSQENSNETFSTDALGMELKPVEETNDDSFLQDEEPVTDSNEPVEKTSTEEVAGETGQSQEQPANEETSTDVQIIENEDGSFSFGKFKAKTKEELLFEVHKSLENAQKLVGRKAESLYDNPFLENGFDNEDEDEDIFDENDFAQQISNSVISQLQQPQQSQPQQNFDPSYVAQQIRYALDDPAIDEPTLEQALQLALTTQPENRQLRDSILEVYAGVNPIKASTINTNLILAENQFQTEQAMQQQQHEAEQAYIMEQHNLQAFQQATGAFTQNVPDYHVYNDGIAEWMNNPANQPLIQAATGTPASIYAVYQNAYNYAKLKGNVANVQNSIGTFPSQLGLGSLETGGESPVSSTHNTINEDKQPFHDLLGFSMVDK